MPTAKCKKCDRLFDFRTTRGSRLAHYTCKCGGSYEVMSFSQNIKGLNPYVYEETNWPLPSWPQTGPYFFGATSRDGRQWHVDYKNYKFLPILPTKPPIQCTSNLCQPTN